MWSKTPRQTIFDTVNATPGPGAYNPKDAKKPGGNIAFSKQGDRFRREDSTVSSCSTSTNGSTSTRQTALRTNRMHERLHLFEVQIRERDQIISRLKMDKLAASTRYQSLVHSYKQLRRVAAQAIPAQKLPKDISQEIMKILQEEKQNTKDESRPSMSDGEIRDKMSTFIVEMEHEEDPRIAELEEEKARLAQASEENAAEIGRLKASLNSLEAKETEIRTLTAQLERANYLVDSMNNRNSNKDDKLFTTLTELGEAKATIANLEMTLTQMKKSSEDGQRMNEKTFASLQSEIESKDSTLRELKQSFNEMTAALRSSQDEREKLGLKVHETVDALEKALQEKEALEIEGTELKSKYQRRKDELSQLESRIREERQKFETCQQKIEALDADHKNLMKKLESQQKSEHEHAEDFRRQLAQSQENFERQLEEARIAQEQLAAEKVDLEGDLKAAVSRMSTLENQVQSRDQLLEKLRGESDISKAELEASQKCCEELREQLSETSDEVLRLQGQLKLIQSDETDARCELEELQTKFEAMRGVSNEQIEQITVFKAEIEALHSQNAALEENLNQVVLAERDASQRLSNLENETSSIRLLNLATTAELEQTKIALEAAKTDGPVVNQLRSELESMQAEKERSAARIKELEEQMESWVRVRNSLTDELRTAEENLQRAQELHSNEVNMREDSIKLLEQKLKDLKESFDSEMEVMTERFQREKETLKMSMTDTVRELREKCEAEKEQHAILQAEVDILKTETESLIDAKASLTLNLRAKDSEIMQIRNKVAEASFYGSKCQELENECGKLREAVSIIQEELQVTRQELIHVQDELTNEQRCNEAHATLTLAIMETGATGERHEALLAENENLKHQLSSFNQLLDTLETGIETSEAKNSVYVKSYAQMQQQIERLVGHSNNKQRIHYVGKLQTENRELKEEQAKLRSKSDSLVKKISQLEIQLRRYKDKENKPDLSMMSNVSTYPSRPF